MQNLKKMSIHGVAIGEESIDDFGDMREKINTQKYNYLAKSFTQVGDLLNGSSGSRSDSTVILCQLIRHLVCSTIELYQVRLHFVEKFARFLE